LGRQIVAKRSFFPSRQQVEEAAYNCDAISRRIASGVRGNKRNDRFAVRREVVVRKDASIGEAPRTPLDRHLRPEDAALNPVTNHHDAAIASLIEKALSVLRPACLAAGTG